MSIGRLDHARDLRLWRGNAIDWAGLVVADVSGFGEPGAPAAVGNGKGQRMYDCFFDVAYATNGRRRLLFVVVAVLLAAVTVYVSVSDTDLLTWVLVLPQVALFAAVVLLLLRWLGNLHPQPPGHWVFALVWGATGAYVLADVLGNLVRPLGWFGLSPNELSDWTAGPREELTKIIPVLVLFLICRRSFNGVLSAIVIGAVVGTGFQLIENIDNFTSTMTGDPVLGYTGWPAAELNLWIVRDLSVPLAHQSWTALAAMGFGIAAVNPSRTVRVLAPLGPLVAAMVLHSSSDTVVQGLIVPVLSLILVIVVAVCARKNLRRLAAEELPAYVEHHDITEHDAATAPSTKKRRKAARAERQRHGRTAARVLHRRYDAVMDLAILRRRRSTLDNQQEPEERRRILIEIARLTPTGT